MKNSKAATVDEYLAGVPTDSRRALAHLRAVVKSAAPQAEELISYRIPCYKYRGPLIFFAAFENHCSLFAVGKSISKNFKSELEPFHTSGTTIHFSPDHPIPDALVKKIVKARILENEARSASAPVKTSTLRRGTRNARKKSPTKTSRYGALKARDHTN